MDNINVLGLDLAKESFHIIGLDKKGRQIFKKKLSRTKLIQFVQSLSACTIAMEGCASSHYWAREFEKLGHQVKILPAQYVKAYVRGNKNDYNDALAIAEASLVPEMRIIQPKTEEQQSLQALHRIRSRSIKERTSLCNQTRSLLAEFGLIFPKGVSSIRQNLERIISTDQYVIPEVFREALELKYIQLCRCDEMIEQLTQMIEQESKKHQEVELLKTIPGYGAIVASSFFGFIGDGKGFNKGRDVGAALGVVPKQYSTGGKQVLLGISKRGNKYLRSLLIHGARAVIVHAEKKEDALSLWVMKLIEKKGKNKATVALANKLARIGWAVITSGKPFQYNYEG